VPQRKTIADKVRCAVAQDIEAIFKNRFFTALHENAITLDGIKLFANEYFWASNGFPKILATACAGMSTDELRMPFVTNLWDEHGQGKSISSHRAMLGRFLEFLQIIPVNAVGGPADRYVAAMVALCRDATEAGLLGIIGPGCEAFTPREYRVIVQHLQNNFSIPDTALEFFLDHINHDHQHISALYNAFEVAVKDDNDLSDAIEGAKKAVAIEQQFWTDMHAHIMRDD